MTIVIRKMIILSLDVMDNVILPKVTRILRFDELTSE